MTEEFQRELKDELRRVSDSLIKLQEQFEAHKEMHNIWMEREEQYRREQIVKSQRHDHQIEDLQGQMKDVTIFKANASRHFWIIYSAVIGFVLTLASFALRNLFMR